MKLQTKSLIDSGNIGKPSAFLVVCDMLSGGQISLSLKLYDMESSETLSFTFSSTRNGYNAFWRKVNTKAYKYFDIEITGMKKVRSVTDIYFVTTGEIKA